MSSLKLLYSCLQFSSQSPTPSMNRVVEAIRSLHDVAFDALVLQSPGSKWKVVAVIFGYGHLLGIRLKQGIKSARDTEGFAHL